MWASMESNDIITQVFSYKTNAFEEVRHARIDTCEDVCRELCRRWRFRPLVQLLFGLRNHKTKLWLGCNRQLVEGEQYEFRIRFKVPKIKDLRQHDESCYAYFYQQVRHDVLCNNIPEIKYPQSKNEVLGLCCTDMYLEMIENSRSVDYLKSNLRNYIPKEIMKRHRRFARSEVESKLKSLNEYRSQQHDALYIKDIYLQQVDKMAPNYLTEEYNATAANPDENNRQRCHVLLQITPFHLEEPGLRIHYPYSWKHIAKFSDFYTIQIDESTNEVCLEIQSSPMGIPIKMESIQLIESFVGCLSGYYRLMVKWSMDLCPKLMSPWLKYLNENKLHGPIGGAFSYNKIEEKNSAIGSLIIRQCERVFDTFYIDIVTKENQIETFRILRDVASSEEKWKLHVAKDDVREFNELIDLIKSFDGVLTRISPSTDDKAPFLLLCQTPSKLMSKEPNNSLRDVRPILFSASDDLLLYNWTQREYGDGLFTRMKAEIIQANRKKKEATLKVLKQNSVGKHLQDFIALADLWAKLDISEIVKLHGITLGQPISYVMESISYGPLDDLLRNTKYKKDIKLLDLVETAYGLAKALHFLQEHHIVHGKIRCSTLQVIEFTPNQEFVVKLGDPGLSIELTENDVPWIAIECYEDLSSCRKNLKSDIWAYATTIWEIFSRGASMTPFYNNKPMQFFREGRRLPKPTEIADFPGIYEIMLKGWDPDPDKRFPPQTVFTCLLAAKTKLHRYYSEISNNNVKSNGKVHSSNGTIGSRKLRMTSESDFYSGSVLSNATDQTFLTTPGTTQAYIEHCGSSVASNQSNGGSSSQVSLLNGSEGSSSTILCFEDDQYFGEVPGVLEFSGIRVVFRGKLGSGNFGRVYKGLMITTEDSNTDAEVAIKLLRMIDSNDNFRDFQREAKIMKDLNHENIVKIYGYCEQPLSIIMEHMKHGSLHSYLSYNRPTLTLQNLVNFGIYIARGMNYLGSKQIVHRDLAARNVLVGDGGRVKIADFGLAQFTDNDGYYHFSTNCRSLPVKWYAPETLTQRKFSHKSDVWSFGVTLYEIFTFGESPNLKRNSRLDADEILALLTNGERLECPKFCPQSIYEEIMFVCWNFNPRLRPTFSDLLERLICRLNENGESI